MTEEKLFLSNYPKPKLGKLSGNDNQEKPRGEGRFRPDKKLRKP